jgi:hypothetical protein
MKKLKIVFLIFFGIVLISLIVSVVFLVKRSQHWENEYLLEKHSNEKYQILHREAEKKAKKYLQEADYYKSKWEHDEKKLDSIRIVALRDNDKAVLEFFTNREWRNSNSRR